MRNPRLETVLGLAIQLILAFTCVYIVLTIMLSFLSSHLDVIELPDVAPYFTFITSMVGGVGIMICATLMSVAEQKQDSEIPPE